MEPNFICYDNLTFDDEKKFSINFSDEDTLEGAVFKKNESYYITSITCYVDLTVDITKLPNYAKSKQTSGLATAILRGGVDYRYGKKVADLILYFVLTNLEEINTLKTQNFLMLKIKTQKTYILFSIQRAKR